MHQSWYSPPVGFATSAATPPPVFAEERLMRTWEATGSFWIPRISHECWGTLSFRPGEGVQLTLEGSLFGEGPHIPFEIPIIHGRLYDGTLCSIFSCWCAVETFGTTQQYYRTQVTSRLSALGGHWESPGECTLESVQVKFSHLNEWFKVPYNLEFEGDEFERCKISFDGEELLSQLDFRDVAVTLKSFCARTIPMAASRKVTSWRYSYQIVLTPCQPQGLTWFIDLIAAARDMFAFLIGSGVSTLDVSGAQSGIGLNNQVLVQYPVAVPRAVRLENRYFSTRYTEHSVMIPKIITTWFSRRAELSVATSAYRELLCSDGASPATILLRTVQTLEHLYGLIWPDDSKYVKKATFKCFIKWLRGNFPVSLENVAQDEMSRLQTHQEIVLSRIGGINDLSLRSKLEHLFKKIPEGRLMPILGNPRSCDEFLDEFLKRLEATRHYHTHFSVEQQELSFGPDEIEGPALQCWAVLTFWLASCLGMDSVAAGDLALQAKDAMFFVHNRTSL